MQNPVTISVMVCYFVVFTTAANVQDACTSNSDCTPTNSYCEKMFSNCDKGTCSCKDGYSSTNGNTKCAMNRGNGESCGADYYCMYDTICSNNVCGCDSGYTYNANLKDCISTGKKEIGVTCTTTENCYDANPTSVECVANSGTTTPKYCRCLSGYITEGYSCRKPHASETCTTGVGCAPMASGIGGLETETCSGGKCTCPNTADMLSATLFGSTYTVCLTKSTANKADGTTCTAVNECNSQYCDTCPGASAKTCLRPISGTSRVTGLTLTLGLLIFVGFL